MFSEEHLKARVFQQSEWQSAWTDRRLECGRVGTGKKSALLTKRKALNGKRLLSKLHMYVYKIVCVYACAPVLQVETTAQLATMQQA